MPILMDKLLDANHMQASDLQLSRLEQTPATVAFLDGKMDVLVFASAPESPMVQMLLQTPGVRLMDFPQNEAYGRRFPFLTPVTLPRGVVDLAGNVPAHDVRMMASTTALLTRAETHPALLQLFAQHAQTLHSGAGWFNRAREFPSTSHSELDIAPEADRAINEPVPLLQRYLPFWLANLIQRMWLVLGILIAVMLPLSRIVPPLYQLRVRSRVFRWYGRLRAIEDDMASGHVRPLRTWPWRWTRWRPRSRRSVCRCPMPMNCTRCATISRWCAAGWRAENAGPTGRLRSMARWADRHNGAGIPRR